MLPYRFLYVFQTFILGIYPLQVSRILKEREKWEKEISGAARKSVTQNKKLPWYVRLVSRFI